MAECRVCHKQEHHCSSCDPEPNWDWELCYGCYKGSGAEALREECEQKTNALEEEYYVRIKTLVEALPVQPKVLISLEDFQKTCPQTQYIYSPHPLHNGIACPSCGQELYDSRPGVTLTSDPAQKDIHCQHCSFRGYRYA